MIGKIGYGVTIGLFSLMMAGSGVAYLSGNEHLAALFRHLGYPDYFRTLLGVAKLVGVVALLAPGMRAYAGFAITMVAAAISHVASGDPVGRVAAPLFALALLVTARALWRTHGNSRGLRA